ncbi:hypothetical protein LTR05_008796 [Lithohypha guttulata]|uniref:Uncharacterized protein n=1 Tax=Lithohypha guttulata TaxID=1690604 RepID=A0AAN7PH74_9EURO|nr:hypothetical protein LTR05_008796 [Lithohypha guttulata]
MAQWSVFFEQENVALVFVVGLTEQRLSCLSRGPTQAERVLIHTGMLTLAHERRLVVSQTGRDISRFEDQHITDVRRTLGWLQGFFDQHATTEAAIHANPIDEALIGLASSIGLSAPTSSSNEVPPPGSDRIEKMVCSNATLKERRKSFMGFDCKREAIVILNEKTLEVDNGNDRIKRPDNHCPSSGVVVGRLHSNHSKEAENIANFGNSSKT